MIKVFNKLSVLKTDDDANFDDFSNAMASYSNKGNATFTLLSSGKLYIGFDRPINTFFVEINTANTQDVTLTLELFDGTSFFVPSGYEDFTNGFKGSDYIQWDRNQDDEQSWDVNGVTQYWYRITSDIDLDAVTLRGLNIVFSDDEDLKREFDEIDEFLPDGETSFILKHEASRNQIIQDLRADAKYKYDFEEGYAKDITAFDLLDISQVNQASTYLTLSKIFMIRSDEVDDKYEARAQKFFNLYNRCMNTFYLDLDRNNDGKQDISERMRSNTASMTRR